jgi:hypothetical protein
MQRTSKGDCKAPEIVQGEAIHGWRFIPVGSCPQGTLIGESFVFRNEWIRLVMILVGALPGCGWVDVSTFGIGDEYDSIRL